MTKKQKNWRGRSRTTASVIKSINKDNFASAICPTNVEEQKKKFLELGKTPEFTHRGTEDELEEIYQKPRSEIRFDLLGEAMHILKVVKEKYGDAENYYSEMYGDKITKAEATDIIVDYLKENHLDGAMSIIWCTDLPCSGRMMWQGPHVKYRRPEARKYSMWIKDSRDNNFLREQGMRCLADHEIGTHFYRSVNDGKQVWFEDRVKYGLREEGCLELMASEEGLAAINTNLRANTHYLFGPALSYYIACKATEMTFKQLFEHLALYVQNPEWRWRHCVRVKRGLLNPNDIGGYGKDQCYFEGAVEILRNLETIDFKLLMSGKICFDECDRIKKLARLDFIQMPAFMKNQEKYKKSLKQIAHLNGLHLTHGKFKAPMAYLRKLKRGRRIGVAGGSNKVRKKGRKGGNSRVGGGKAGVGGVSRGDGDSDEDDDEDDESSDEERYFFQNYGLSDCAKKATRDGVIFAKAGSRQSTLPAASLSEHPAYQRSMILAQNGINDLTNEKDSFEYYRKFVANMEKMKRELEEKEREEEEAEARGKSGTRPGGRVRSGDRKVKQEQLPKFTDSDTECSPSTRCVSRASIHSLLNSRSFSLNSRNNKNSNADEDSCTSYQQELCGGGGRESLSRPRSNYSSSVYSHHSTVSDPSLTEATSLNPDPLLHNKPRPNALVPLSHPSSSPTSHDHHTSVFSSGNTYPPSNPDLAHTQPDSRVRSGYRLVQHSGNTAKFPTKSVSSQNLIKTEADGFIYPSTSTDILTDDMIKVKDGGHLSDLRTIRTENEVLGPGSGDNTLLSRRAKSAANVLPKIKR